ncbi:MAG: HD domain-containing phosphohydrolase [Bryobacteraceae bacterium]|jgi:diguanylate cyclase (GGDEF)-like protein/putative nucleotidyltransferase with HDIG domain
MPAGARAYVAAMAAAGVCSLSLGILHWTGTDLPRFLALVVLGVLCSTLKVSLPGATSTLSVNYIFVLIASSICDLPQTLIVATGCFIAQTFLRAKARPHLVHVLFNSSSSMVLVAATYGVYHSTLLRHVSDSIPFLFLCTSLVYFFLNTGSVAAIVALTERKNLIGIWRNSYLWTAPQYLLGGTVAALFTALSGAFGWQWALLVVPSMWGLYSSYRLYLGRFEEQERHAREMSDLHLRAIEALAVAIDAKDETTHDHLRRVQVYSMEIARQLGLSGLEIQALQAAALLHDIGKLAVPEYILSKPGRLTPEEFERIKVHPAIGAEILDRVRFPYPVVPIVAAHHEKWNGSGYPKGLKGEEIPIGARILAVVDCLDALASDRQYRRALPLSEAMEEIAAQAGSSFDPQVVKVLQLRYRELEELAKARGPDTTKLTRPADTGHGTAPDAGFAQVAAGAPEDAPNFIASIAAARQEFQSLHELTSALGTSLTVGSTLSLLGAHLKSIVPHDSLAIYILEGGTLVPQHVSGVDSALFASMRIPLGQGLSGWVAENRKPIVNGNPLVEPGYLRDPGQFSVLMSATAVPLVGTRGVIGVLTLYSRARDSFTRDHLRLLNAVSSKAAITIEHALELTEALRSAQTDALTGLANTRALFLHLDAELSRCSRSGEALTVLVLDLDGFKQVNDRFGHLTGNRVLRTVAEALRGGSREYDLVARIGGDEFVVVMPGMDAISVSQKSDDLTRLIRRACAECIGEDSVSVSIGRAIYPADGADAEDLLASADRAMYAVKHLHHLSRDARQIEAARLEVVAIQ